MTLCRGQFLNTTHRLFIEACRVDCLGQNLCAFICQLSQIDWAVSREVGVYGNREGSEREGEIRYFSTSARGDDTIQSIIEDLIGMRKGNIVFFHVIKTDRGESSIHGVYRVTEEPFYNETVKIWKSSPRLVYPYRFCFEPDPEHIELCRYDANIAVKDLYRSIEDRTIRSILTLEREERGRAHAVKKISDDDAKEIVKLLYRSFHFRRLYTALDFKPMHMPMRPLRQRISRIGEIEFAIKALVSYELGQENSRLTQHIPACRSGSYDFMIEAFLGQTMRRPTDIICVSTRDSEKLVTIIEAKTELASIEDLVQALEYQQIFRLRNIDRGSLSYRMSTCILAQRFHSDLIAYASIRNKVLPREDIVLLKYVPTENGTDAEFSVQAPVDTWRSKPRATFPRTSISDPLRQVCSKPDKFYDIFPEKRIPLDVRVEHQSSGQYVATFEKSCRIGGVIVSLGHIVIYEVQRRCSLEDLTRFMSCIHEEAIKLQGDFTAVEPILLASDYADSLVFFIDQYNNHEARAGRQPIYACQLPN